jgi:hypothetical protein
MAEKKTAKTVPAVKYSTNNLKRYNYKNMNIHNESKDYSATPTNNTFKKLSPK